MAPGSSPEWGTTNRSARGSAREAEDPDLQENALVGVLAAVDGEREPGTRRDGHERKRLAPVSRSRSTHC
jgi:hypothetical protein